MAKTIGSLSVGLSLSITDFIQNLDKVKKDMESLDGVTRALSGTFEKSVAGIMGDAVHKFAKASKLGADGAVAFVKELKAAGVSSDAIKTTLERTSGVLSKFADKAGDAGKALLGIFTKIGNSDKVFLKDIQALEAMGFKAFKTMADELTKVEKKAVSVDEVMKRIAKGAMSGQQAFKLLTGKVDEAVKGQQAPTKGGPQAPKGPGLMSRAWDMATSPVSVIGGALASYGVYQIYERAVMAFAKTEEILTRLRSLAGESGAARIGSVLEEIAAAGRVAQDVVAGLANKLLSAGVNSEATASLLASFGRTAQVAGSGAGAMFQKLGDVAGAMLATGQVNAQGFADLAALGLPVYEALAERLTTISGVAVTAAQAMQMIAAGSVGATDAVNALRDLQNNGKVMEAQQAQANTLSGVYARLAGEIEGFFTTMGGAIAEALDLKGFSQSVVGFLQSLKANFDTGLKPAIQTLGAALAAVRDILFSVFEGLVNFLTRFGGADETIGARIQSIRGMVVQFAQGVMGIMARMVDFSAGAIEKLANLAGGAEYVAKMFAGFAGGAATGAVVGAPFLGIGSWLGAGIGGLSGALGVSMSNDKNGPGVDLAGFRAEMATMFQSINDSIGSVGGEAANTLFDNFVNNLREALKSFQDVGENTVLTDFLSGTFGDFFLGLENGLNDGTIGFRQFLNQLGAGSVSAVAMFKREMELGNLSVEEFEDAVGSVRQNAIDALINAFSAGKITGAEFDAELAKLQATFDSLEPPADIIAPFRDSPLPDWIEKLASNESPLDAYRRKLTELQDALALQRISPEQFAAGATLLADELEHAVGMVEELKHPGALLAGSREAFSQVLKIQNQKHGENAQQRLERLAARANELAAQQAATQNAILAATLNNNPIVTATFGG